MAGRVAAPEQATQQAARQASKRLPWRALLVATALAGVGHVVVLAWLAATWQEPVRLQAFAAPLLTRQILPSTPISVPKPPDASVDRSSVATNTVAPSTRSQTPTQVTTPDRSVAEAGSNPAQTANTPDPNPTSTPTPTPAPASRATAALVAEALAATGNGSAASTASPSTGAATASTTTIGTATNAPSEPAPLADTLARWPADTRLSYLVGGYYRGDLHGKAQVLWQRQAERYQVRVSVDMGLVDFVMTSQGRVQAEGLHPSVYDEKITPGPRRGVELTDSHLVMTDGQRLPRPPRVQDTASQFVELTWRLLSGQTSLSQGSSVRYWMARPGGADEWVYDVVALETLQTRLGPVPAWHLVPRPLSKPRGNITAEMWFAPSLQYLPARIKLNLGTEANVDMLIDKLEQR